MSTLIPLKFRIRTTLRKILKFFVLNTGWGLLVSIFLTISFFNGIYTGAVLLASRSNGGVFYYQVTPEVFWVALVVCGVGFLCLVCTAYAWVRDEKMRRGEF